MLSSAADVSKIKKGFQVIPEKPFFGEDDGSRTHDLLNHNQTL